MAKHVELLLTESVDALGIVGDVVRVRTGYARNYLLPNNMATTPTEEKIKSLATKRADAEQHQRELRSQREALTQRLEGVEVSVTRSCNDQGQLYGSVSQQDIAEALLAAGFGITARDVRLSQVIKRVDSYHIPIKLDRDLEAEITLKVVADRAMNLDDREEMEFDNEGELIEKPRGAKGRKAEPAPEEAPAAEPAKKGKKDGAAPEPEKKTGFSKPKDKAEPADKPEKSGKADKKGDDKKGKKKGE